ncbi:MAG: hypothetical protein RIR00_173, partial [Pseudomonadota bacterium]
RREGLRAFGRFNRPVLAAGCAACVAAFAGLQLASLPPESAPAFLTRAEGEAQLAGSAAQGKDWAGQAAAGADAESAANAAAGASGALVLPANPKAYVSQGTATASFRLDQTDIRITALGDSVMLGARPVLTRRLPIVTLDAEVGRQGIDVLKAVRRLGESGELADIVLIHIGSNGYIFEQNLKQILHFLQDRKQVVFVNIHADRYWVEANNALLRKYQAMYDNITLIDWNGAAEGHPEYFVKDGVHLTDKGMLAYAEMIRVALGVPELSGWVPAPLARSTATKKGAPLPAGHDHEESAGHAGETPAPAPAAEPPSPPEAPAEPRNGSA